MATSTATKPNFTFNDNIIPKIHSGVNQNTGKILFVDLKPGSLNFHTRFVDPQNKIKFSCIFDCHHKIGSPNKYIKHVKKCRFTSHLGLNGLVPRHEAKQWIFCKYDFFHLIHKDFYDYHINVHCSSKQKTN